MRLDLPDHDVELLADVLDIALSDLTSEIAHTDNRVLRQELKDRRERLRGLIGLVADQTSAAAPS